MIVESYSEKTHEPFNYRLDKHEVSKIVSFFKESSFTESRIIEILNVSDLEHIQERAFPIYSYYTQNNSVVDVLIKLFILHIRVDYNIVKEVLEENTEKCIALGLIKVESSIVESLVDLYPCAGLYIATDHRFRCKVGKDRVYYLGKDSYSLVRGMVDKQVENTLDLCTGSGVHAIFASRFSKHVFCTDINPRAISFVKFNSFLNGINNVHPILTNLYEDVPKLNYDLIVSNPPFVPDPEYNHYFNSTITGEYILQQIIEKLPDYLSKDGVCQIFTLLIRKENSHYLERIKEWLVGEFSVLAYEDLNFRYSSDDYILRHCDEYRDEENYAERLLEWFLASKKEGNKVLSDGILNIKYGRFQNQYESINVNLSFEYFSDYVKSYFEEGKAIVSKLVLNPQLSLVKEEVGSNDQLYYVLFNENCLYRSVEVSYEEYVLLKHNIKNKKLNLEYPEILKLNLSDHDRNKLLQRLMTYRVLI